jgi:O-antigen/teichoic acid export membrane protein
MNAAVLTSLSFAGLNVIRFANNLVLSFLLAPEVFGLMALANITVQAVQMFLELGIGTFLIQHARGDEPGYVNTAWTIQLIRGPIVAFFVCLLAFPLSQW